MMLVFGIVIGIVVTMLIGVAYLLYVLRDGLWRP